MMGRRLEKAQALLQETDMPLASIAMECGFADQAHLTNAFSKQFGSPPEPCAACGATMRAPCSELPFPFIHSLEKCSAQ
jgi:transcriptional regulator GlxA family with amidase domain